MSRGTDNLFLSYYTGKTPNGQGASIYLNKSEVAAISQIDHRRIGGLKDEEQQLLSRVVVALKTAINT